MRVGDTVEVDGVKAKVLRTSDITTLDFQEVISGKRRWIGVAPYCGNPRIKVVKRGRGKPVPTAEWCGGKSR